MNLLNNKLGILLLLILIFYLFELGNSQSKTLVGETIIEGEFKGPINSDSIRLFLKQDNSVFSSVLPNKEYIVPVNNGKFKFKISDNFEYPIYFSLDSITSTNKNQTRIRPFLNNYILDKNDSINFIIEKDNWIFSGKGAEKNSCRFAMDTVMKAKITESGKHITILNGLLHDLKRDSIISEETFLDRFYSAAFKKELNELNAKKKILEKYKSEIPNNIYQLLYIDLIASEQHKIYSSTFVNYTLKLKGNENLKNLRHIFQSNTIELKNFPDDVLTKSNYYIEYIVDKEIVDNYFTLQKYDNDKLYSKIKKSYSGDFQEKILTYYLYYFYLGLKKGDSLVNDALNSVVKKSEYIKLLNNSKTTAKGNKAYNFNLPNLSGTTTRLSDFKGKIVFLDFYYKGCGGCAIYYQNVVSKVKERLRNNSDVVFIAISIDKKKEDWINAVKSGKYTSNQAVNLYTEGLGPNHPVIKKNFIISYPTPILINRAGEIICRNATDLGLGNRPSFEENVLLLQKQIDLALNDI